MANQNSAKWQRRIVMAGLLAMAVWWIVLPVYEAFTSYRLFSAWIGFNLEHMVCWLPVPLAYDHYGTIEFADYSHNLIVVIVTGTPGLFDSGFTPMSEVSKTEATLLPGTAYEEKFTATDNQVVVIFPNHIRKQFALPPGRARALHEQVNRAVFDYDGREGGPVLLRELSNRYDGPDSKALKEVVEGAQAKGARGQKAQRGLRR